MRITKEIAESVAKQLTEKQRKNAEELKLKFRQVVTDIYNQQVPKEVMKLFKTHSQYVKTTTNGYLDGQGFNREYVTLVGSVPAISNGGYVSPTLTSSEAAQLVKLKNAADTAKAEYEALAAEVENALYNLRTYAKVQANFPEAVKYLPQQNMSVAINFADIRKKLNLAA